ncbi:hypothetical protein K474DRAFT_1680894, partial [Panus rudis PR-1116 ss-1]
RAAYEQCGLAGDFRQYVLVAPVTYSPASATTASDATSQAQTPPTHPSTPSPSPPSQVRGSSSLTEFSLATPTHTTSLPTDDTVSVPDMEAPESPYLANSALRMPPLIYPTPLMSALTRRHVHRHDSLSVTVPSSAPSPPASAFGGNHRASGSPFQCFAVIRGLEPGIYFSLGNATAKLGTHPDRCLLMDTTFERLVAQCQRFTGDAWACLVEDDDPLYDNDAGISCRPPPVVVIAMYETVYPLPFNPSQCNNTSQKMLIGRPSQRTDVTSVIAGASEILLGKAVPSDTILSPHEHALKLTALNFVDMHLVRIRNCPLIPYAFTYFPSIRGANVSSMAGAAAILFGAHFVLIGQEQGALRRLIPVVPLTFGLSMGPSLRKVLASIAVPLASVGLVHRKHIPNMVPTELLACMCSVGQAVHNIQDRPVCWETDLRKSSSAVSLLPGPWVRDYIALPSE